MKFLCLHGRGTNSKVLELQIAPIIHALGSEHEFLYVEGSIPAPPAPEIKNLIHPDEECFDYCNNPLTYLTALNDLTDHLTHEGPFDAILGFSQGALLAATLMIRHQALNPTADPLFKCCIFLCAGPVHDPLALERGEMRLADGRTAGVPIRVPTAHVVGRGDGFCGEDSRRLVGLCGEGLREVFEHGGGHEVPRGPEGVVRGMVGAIEETIRKVQYLQ